MSRSVEWAGLVGMITFFTKKEHMPTQVCYEFCCAPHHGEKPISLSPIIIIQEECMNTLGTLCIHMVYCYKTFIVYKCVD